MTIKNEILRGLIDQSKMTTSEIADYCGYKNNPNKYGVVDKPLKELVKENLIIRGSISNEKGRPASIYAINEDLNTILNIYHFFEDLRGEIRHQDWIIELIILYKMNIEDIDLYEELRQMFKLSETFFYFSLYYKSVDQIANFWSLMKRGIIFDKDSEEEIVSYDEYRDFFSYCIFCDCLKGINIDQSLNFLYEIYESDHSFEENSMNSIMFCLKKVCELYEKTDNSSFIKKIGDLNFMINVYETKLRANEELSDDEGRPDPETHCEMIEIFNKVRNVLNF